MHHGGFVDGIKFQRMGLKGIHEGCLRRRQLRAITPEPRFLPRAPTACRRQQTGACRMRHACDPDRKAIQQKDARGIPRCFGNGGLWRLQNMAEQDGFSTVCHAAHAACAPRSVKHHGARRRFVLR